MPTTVSLLPEFRRDLKQLKRKYPAVTAEVQKLVSRLENDERPGDKMPNLGYDVYKVRLPNPSAQRGKRGGFRALYYVRLAEYVILIAVYSKTEQADVDLRKLRRFLDRLNDDT